MRKNCVKHIGICLYVFLFSKIMVHFSYSKIGEDKMEELKREELQKILNQIENLYYVDNIEDRKDELLNLWTRYYQLSYSYHVQLDSAYNLFLLGENVCYVIDSKLNRQENMEVPNDAVCHLLEVLKENKDSLVNGISYQEATQILDYVINKTWNNLAHFGIETL